MTTPILELRALVSAQLLYVEAVASSRGLQSVGEPVDPRRALLRARDIQLLGDEARIVIAPARVSTAPDNQLS